jgi:HTH-type transcriptional regulator/antitoxin HigA
MKELAPIRDAAGYESAVAEMRRLWGAKPGTPARDRLEIIGLLIDAYESATWPYEPRDPVEAISGHMENEGLTQKDLAAVLGSKARASEILRRRRALTLPMIWSLARAWKIPAEILIRPYRLAKPRSARTRRGAPRRRAA